MNIYEGKGYLTDWIIWGFNSQSMVYKTNGLSTTPQQLLVPSCKARDTLLLDFGFVKDIYSLFDLILYIPSTIFQSCRDGSSWVEPVLS